MQAPCEIEVRLPAPAGGTDADVAAAAIQALQRHPFVPAEEVKVTVSHGWVTLEGAVRWRFERHAAERAVRGLSSVRGVLNGVTSVDTRSSWPDPPWASARCRAHG